ncbi:basic salivary proline-rich protein 1-like [Dermochelys coriacea]|uniref:basic salivary proline-rich protein 1-like n=1 Tax=Dermochelys coriacea TaxID=27794 RepID=UPI0018E80AC6|nr:basic salivary proline-rich protein 1-like [Dermochelys coriacea]
MCPLPDRCPPGQPRGRPDDAGRGLEASPPARPRLQQQRSEHRRGQVPCGAGGAARSQGSREPLAQSIPGCRCLQPPVSAAPCPCLPAPGSRRPGIEGPPPALHGPAAIPGPGSGGSPSPSRPGVTGSRCPPGRALEGPVPPGRALEGPAAPPRPGVTGSRCPPRPGVSVSRPPGPGVGELQPPSSRANSPAASSTSRRRLRSQAQNRRAREVRGRGRDSASPRPDGPGMGSSRPRPSGAFLGRAGRAGSAARRGGTVRNSGSLTNLCQDPPPTNSLPRLPPPRFSQAAPPTPTHKRETS